MQLHVLNCNLIGKLYMYGTQGHGIVTAGHLTTQVMLSTSNSAVETLVNTTPYYAVASMTISKYIIM